jgi:hypothetical protein
LKDHSSTPTFYIEYRADGSQVLKFPSSPSKQPSSLGSLVPAVSAVIAATEVARIAWHTGEAAASLTGSSGDLLGVIGGALGLLLS